MNKLIMSTKFKVLNLLGILATLSLVFIDLYNGNHSKAFTDSLIASNICLSYLYLTSKKLLD